MYIIDTNIFNKLLDGEMETSQMPKDAEYAMTHVQVDEINNTGDKERRARLLLVMSALRPHLVPTETVVCDVSRFDHAKFDGPAYSKLKSNLDAKNNSKPNNVHDALIAEVAIVNNYTLLTADRDLAAVHKELGGNVQLFGT